MTASFPTASVDTSPLLDEDRYSMLLDVMEEQDVVFDLLAKTLADGQRLAVSDPAAGRPKALAHLIKGSAGNIGLMALSDAARQVEKCPDSEVAACLTAFAGALERTRIHLDARLPRTGGWAA